MQSFFFPTSSAAAATTAAASSSRLIRFTCSSPSRLFSSSSIDRSDTASTSDTSSTTLTDSSTESTDPATTLGSRAAASNSSSNATGRGGGKGYRAWLNGDGAQYRKGIKGRTNWIGDTPFPLNPTFKPLPPVSDQVKLRIYNSYLGAISSSSSSSTTTPATDQSIDSIIVRAISSKFGLSMPRIRAIIRLKELEQQWKDDKKPLQTELLKGMEAYLGVKEIKNDSWRGIEDLEGDLQVENARQKTAFEMVDVEKDEQPVFLPLLDQISTRTPERSPSTNAEERTKIKIVPASRPGRPSFVFQDVSRTSKGQELARTYDPKKTKRGNRAKKIDSVA